MTVVIGKIEKNIPYIGRLKPRFAELAKVLQIMALNDSVEVGASTKKEMTALQNYVSRLNQQWKGERRFTRETVPLDDTGRTATRIWRVE